MSHRIDTNPMLPMNNLAARIEETKKEIAHAETLVENAAFRFEVLGSDTYTENGKTHFYPKGKAARTRLFKRRDELSRLKARLANLETELVKATAVAALSA